MLATSVGPAWPRPLARPAPPSAGPAATHVSRIDPALHCPVHAARSTPAAFATDRTRWSAGPIQGLFCPRPIRGRSGERPPPDASPRRPMPASAAPRIRGKERRRAIRPPCRVPGHDVARPGTSAGRGATAPARSVRARARGRARRDRPPGPLWAVTGDREQRHGDTAISPSVDVTTKGRFVSTCRPSLASGRERITPPRASPRPRDAVVGRAAPVREWRGSSAEARP